jgi:hypothetical protein
MQGGDIRRRSLQITRDESFARPPYFLWLSHRLTRITCQMHFLRRQTGGEVGESGGQAPAGGGGRAGLHGNDARRVYPRDRHGCRPLKNCV